MNITQAITVRYIYSACVITKTPDLSILHDPWFTEGIYDGSWFHFPKVQDPMESIGDVDCIYVSHIHPDHYDSAFLKSYFEKFGVKEVLIANHFPNYLAGKMRSDGIEPTIISEPLIIGNTSIDIIPHKTGSYSDIDSAIIIKYEENTEKVHCVVNVNDIIFDEKIENEIKASAKNIDILLCGYTGAGPYPQTYFDISDPQLPIEAANKKQAFFERYRKLVGAMNAKVNVPFAGKYVLGGKLAPLNAMRGVADPVEVLDFDGKSVVLSDNGGEIDTYALKATGSRSIKYDELEVKIRIDEIKNEKMDYERLISQKEIHQLPLKRLLLSAVRNAVRKSECDDDYFFCIKIQRNEYAIINSNRKSENSVYFTDNNCDFPTPRSEIIIDNRYLFGLLVNIYHWNNAEVGSQYYTRRVPNILNRKAQRFLNNLTISMGV